VIPFELGGTAHMDFAAKGLHCKFEVPANWFHGRGGRRNKSGSLASARTDMGEAITSIDAVQGKDRLH
jgi:hypothetical protein